MPEPTDSTDQPKEAKKRGLPNVVVRFLTAAVGIPILVWMLDYAPTWVFALVGVVAAGIGASELATVCRFADCLHEAEPGCAVLAAIEAGELDAGRLGRYHKLRREDRRNTETVAERRSRDKQFGRLIKSVKVIKEREKGGGN